MSTKQRWWFALGLPGNGAVFALGVEHQRWWWIVLGAVGVSSGIDHIVRKWNPRSVT